MQAHSATARQCLDLAAAAAPAMLTRAIDQAVAALQEEERRSQSVVRRQELADAWLELSRRRQDWAQRYPSLLRMAQTGQESGRADPGAASLDRSGDLALIDEKVLTQTLESSRLLQLLAPRLEQPLAELDALMSTALDLQTVQPERNPLRPQVFAQSLWQLMQQPAQQPDWPGLWSRHLAGPLAREIETLYRDALRILHEARLEAASYRVLPVACASAASATPAPRAASSRQPQDPGAGPGTVAPAQPGFGSPAGAARAPAGAGQLGGPALGGPAWADLSRFQLGDELFQHFLFARTPPSMQALAPAYFAQVDAQLVALQTRPDDGESHDLQAVQRARAMPPVERPHRPVTSANGLDAAAWGRWAPARERALVRSQLKKDAHQVGQVLGLEVVRKVVDQVGSDARLLAPVREAVVALEPALLRLALVSPRFLGQEDHAGRRLVERVAERSFRYNDEFSTEFQQFFAGVRSAFHGLNDKGEQDDASFATALRQLEERWSAEDVVEEHGRQVAVGAVHFAEAREAEAARIAWTLSQRADLDGVPAVVQDFLYGPWSLVMAHARLTDPDGGIDPGGWNAVVSNLLWSVKGEQTLRDPARLIATIPGLLERLRSGIGLLGQEPADHESLFAALEKLHRPVLKLRAKRRHGSQPLDPEPQVDAALLSTLRRQPRARRDDPWMTPHERQAAGFDAEHSSAAAPLAAAALAVRDDAVAQEPSAAANPEAVGPAQVIDSLSEGCWVDLCSHGRWLRASLSWRSSRASLFMFVSHGGRPHSMTRRSLERLVRDRLLRPVEGGAVVGRAMEALSAQRGGDAPRTALAPARQLQVQERLAA